MKLLLITLCLVGCSTEQPTPAAITPDPKQTGSVSSKTVEAVEAFEGYKVNHDHTPRVDVPKVVVFPKPTSPSVWAKPLKTFGESQLGYSANELESVVVSGRRMSLTLDSKTAKPPDAVAKKIGATKIADLPPKQFRCGPKGVGPRVGGDYKIQDATFSVYHYGCIHEVEINDVSADAVLFLLGPKFLKYFETCQNLTLGPACRTTKPNEIRVKTNTPGLTATGTFLWSMQTEGEWLVGSTSEDNAGAVIDELRVFYDPEFERRASCVTRLPELQAPAVCGMKGERFSPAEPCVAEGLCQHLGACDYRDGACFATSDEMCRKSRRCVENGDCFAVGGTCLPESMR